jgi:hypothetical protein
MRGQPDPTGATDWPSVTVSPCRALRSVTGRLQFLTPAPPPAFELRDAPSQPKSRNLSSLIVALDGDILSRCKSLVPSFPVFHRFRRTQGPTVAAVPEYAEIWVSLMCLSLRSPLENHVAGRKLGDSGQVWVRLGEGSVDGRQRWWHVDAGRPEPVWASQQKRRGGITRLGSSDLLAELSNGP